MEPTPELVALLPFMLDTWWELSIWKIIYLSLGNFLVVDKFFWHTSTNMGFYFEHIVVLFFNPSILSSKT